MKPTPDHHQTRLADASRKQGSLRRYCWCRGDDGRQLGSRCPGLESKSHGAWSYQVDLPQLDGRRRQMHKGGFRTVEDASAALAAKVADLKSGDYRDDQNMTVAVYLNGWLARKVEDGLRPSSARMYTQYIAKDLNPIIGRFRLSALTPGHVDTLIRNLRRAGRGPATVNRIHATLRSALADARRWRLVAFNAATDVVVPSERRALVHPWEPAEIGAFLDHAAGHRLSALFEVLAFAGLRRGEACALRWSDVDLEAGLVTVRSNLVSVSGTVYEGMPKTRRGERRVDIGQRTIGALVLHHLAQDAERDSLGGRWAGTTDRVFTAPTGADLRPDYVSCLFRHLTAQVRFPEDAQTSDEQRRRLRPIRLHDLRHGAASLALAAGFDIFAVSRRLGHSTITTTSDFYGHLIGGLGRQMAEATELLVPSGSSPDGRWEEGHAPLT